MEKLILPNATLFPMVEQDIRNGKTVTIPTKGYSMLPFIRGGRDLVELQAPPPVLRVGDIVLFRMPAQGGSRYVMHRIIAIGDDGRLTIRGDGVPETCECIGPDQVIARAVTILRDGVVRRDPYAPAQQRKVRLWQRLRPIRRYLLWIYRHLPWNRRWQSAE